MSKELEGDNLIEILKKVYQALLLAKDRLSDVGDAIEDQYGEDKLKRTLDNIDDFNKKYPWLSELCKGYIIAAFN